MTDYDPMAAAFGERTGQDVTPDQIKIIDQWLFYQNPEFDEIECYHLPLPIEAECWTDIPVNLSPFGTDDPKVIEATIKKLNRDYL